MEEKIINKKECLYELLFEIERIAKENNLVYNLAYGSALGAVREKGIIDWDMDMDIMVTVDRLDNFILMLETKTYDKYTVDPGSEYNEKSKRKNSLFNRFKFKDKSMDEFHVDIFPIVGAPKSKKLQYIFVKLSYLVIHANTVKAVHIRSLKANVNKPHYKIKTIILKTYYIIFKFLFMLFPTKAVHLIYKKLKYTFPISSSEYVYSINAGTPKTKEIIPKKWIQESVYKQFGVKNYPVPVEFNKYLTQIYGNYNTPKKSNYY